MRFLSKFFVLIAFAMFCTTIFSANADAAPSIKYRVTHVRLIDQGELEVQGYFENKGDRDAYAKCITLDLTLIADNGQEMWSDSGIEHYIDVYVPADGALEYTFYVQNEEIPEYHGKFRYRWHTHTNWDTSAG